MNTYEPFCAKHSFFLMQLHLEWKKPGCGIAGERVGRRVAGFQLNQLKKDCRKPMRNALILLAILSGKRGIRTPGSLTFNGFQDRRNRPLCHLSEEKFPHYHNGLPIRRAFPSGVTEIRTRDTLLAYTRFPGVPLQPLEHHSKCAAFAFATAKLRIFFVFAKLSPSFFKFFYLRCICS